MIKFTLRIDDEQLVKDVDELAGIHGMTRTAFIIQLMEDAVNTGYFPMRDGEGFRAISDAGGRECSAESCACIGCSNPCVV